MSIFIPQGAETFQWIFSSVWDIRPAAGMGTAFTVGDGIKGAWAQVISASEMTRDAWAVYFNCNNYDTITTATPAVMDVGIDVTGGSDYTVLLPNLLITEAGPYTVGCNGVSYYFPIRIPAGSSVAIRGMGIAGTGGNAGNAFIVVYGSPLDSSLVRAGTYCTSFGISGTLGTTVTSGTTSEGAWTQLGSALTRPHWWWQLGFSINNAVTAALVYHADLGIGDGTNLSVAIMDQQIITTAAEQVFKLSSMSAGYLGAVGDGVYGRLQCNGTPDTVGLAAWGIGG